MIYESVCALFNVLVFDFVFDLAEEGVLRADLVLVHWHVTAVGHVVLLVLAGKDSCLVGDVHLLHVAIFAHLLRDAALNLVLQVVVPLLNLGLFSGLIVDLQRDLLLLAQFVGQVCRALRDASLSHLVEHLKLVQKFALVADQHLLLVELLSQLGELGVVRILLVLESCLQVALLVFFHFDHALFSVHLHSQQFSLVIKCNLLLAQLVERLEESLDT